MKKILSLALIFSLYPFLIYAHDESGSGFMAGLSHPVLGIDHLLAMISVGILSAQMGGKAIWTVPLTFVFVMLIGGITGIQIVEEISFVEKAIAISVVVLGITISFERKFPVLLVMGFVGFFAFFHGYAHGVEMPSIAHPAFYAIGFISGTASIHILGVVIGYFSTSSTKGAMVLRFVGAFISGMGLQMLIS